MATENFAMWMESMAASVDSMSQALAQTGRRDPTLEALGEALRDADPFVRYDALKVVVRLMQDKSLFH